MVAKTSACDLTLWSDEDLKLLCAQRGIALPTGGAEACAGAAAGAADELPAGSAEPQPPRETLVAAIKQATWDIRQKRGPSSGLAGWLGAHRNFRAYADGLVAQVRASTQQL